MTLVEFVISLLQTHAQSLLNLEASLGKEDLIGVLETGAPELLNSPWIDPCWFDPPRVRSEESVAYALLRDAGNNLAIPAFLEFHLWAYPLYRVLVEGTLDLQAQIKSQDLAGEMLIDAAFENARTWIEELPIPPKRTHITVQTARFTALEPWFRFRAQMFRALGKRPFRLVTDLHP